MISETNTARHLVAIFYMKCEAIMKCGGCNAR